jgi:hypothetical protein
MIKVRKAYVLVMAGLMASLFIVSASAAFGFSSPLTTIVAGPGLSAAGPTTFDTYSHDTNLASVGAAADAAVNGFSPVPGVLPPIPFGWGGFGPFGVSNAANALTTADAANDHTFATSFSTAGAAGLPFGAVNFAGAFPEFSLNLF